MWRIMRKSGLLGSLFLQRSSRNETADNFQFRDKGRRSRAWAVAIPAGTCSSFTSRKLFSLPRSTDRESGLTSERAFGSAS